MKKVRSRSNDTEALGKTLASSAATYCGKNDRGEVQLIWKGIKFLGLGKLRRKSEVQEKVPKNFAVAEWLYPVASLIGDKTSDVQLTCTGKRTGKSYIFLGQLHRYKGRSTNKVSDKPTSDDQRKRNVKVACQEVTKRIARSRSKTMCDANCNVDPLPVIGEKRERSNRRHKTVNKDLQDEIEWLSRRRAAGEDPYVRMPVLVALTSESRATLYRKIEANKLEAPVKRGRGSFWKMSAIETYMKGTS